MSTTEPTVETKKPASLNQSQREQNTKRPREPTEECLVWEEDTEEPTSTLKTRKTGPSSPDEPRVPQPGDYIVLIRGNIGKAVPLADVFEAMDLTEVKKNNQEHLAKAQELVIKWNKERVNEGKKLINLQYVYSRREYLKPLDETPWTCETKAFLQTHDCMSKEGLYWDEEEDSEFSQAFLKAYRKVEASEVSVPHSQCQHPLHIWMWYQSV